MWPSISLVLIQMWDTLNSFVKATRKLVMSRSSAEASPMLWFEHWLWVSFGAEFERRCQCASCLWAGTSTHLQMNQEVRDRGGCTCLMHSIIYPVMLFSIVTFASQLQVPCRRRTSCEARAAGMGSASECRVLGSTCRFTLPELLVALEQPRSHRAVLCFDPCFPEQCNYSWGDVGA